MATVPPIQKPANGDDARDGWIVTWANMQSGDVGGPGTNLHSFRDHSVQVEGTFGGATCLVVGTIDGVNYRTLRDTSGNLLTFGAPDIREIVEHCVNIVPQVSGGVATSITVTALFGRTKA